MNHPAGARAEVPTVLVIFGITGDLAHKKLIPAIYSLYAGQSLPKVFRFIGFSRSIGSKDDLDRIVNSALDIRNDLKDSSRASFLKLGTFLQGNFNEEDSYRRLHEQLEEIDASIGQCTNKLFYLAVPPQLYETICKNLAASGLTVPCDDRNGWTRVLVEKPFGNNLKTAKKLDALLGKLFREEQIFRIDHYLAKETVQNILAFRFFNATFEPIWNAKHIERVEIKLHEKNGIDDRAEFYNTVGALRDVGQNHMLQMLAIIAMDRPKTLTPDAIREHRAEVFESLKILGGRAFAQSFDRGQYEGFRNELGIPPDSTTETYFRLKVFINNKRFSGVPFILEAGKAMAQSRVEVCVTFKNIHCLCNKGSSCVHANRLVFRIQPDEGISISLWVKRPGLTDELAQETLSFSYEKALDSSRAADAYARLLYDCIRGDQTLFASTREVLASWKFITPILVNIEKVPLMQYPRASEGPSGAL